MTRRFLDDIRADYNAQLVLGTPIEKSVMIAIHLDHLDSTIQDECVIYGQTPVDNHLTTTSYVTISAGFNTTIGGDATFLKPNAVSGEIQSATEAGFSYAIKGQITVIAQNGIRYDFVILRNGIDVTGALGGVTGDGNGDPVGVEITALALSSLSDAIYSIGIRSPQGASDVDIQSIVLSVEIRPTNNP